MNHDLFARLAEKYPFITLCVYASTEYVGIIQNQDSAITTIYDFGSIQHPEIKQKFIELANVWWWESNRSIPINMALCVVSARWPAEKASAKALHWCAGLTEQIHVQCHQSCVTKGMRFLEHKSAAVITVPNSFKHFFPGLVLQMCFAGSDD